MSHIDGFESPRCGVTALGAPDHHGSHTIPPCLELFGGGGAEGVGGPQEHGAVIRRGAKLLHAFTSATVPRVSLVLRKAYGGAYIVMNSRSIGADAVLAWPGAELAVVGAEGAADLVFRREIEAHPERRETLVETYRRDAMDVGVAAGRGSVSEIIDPRDSREAIATLLRSLAGGEPRGYVHDNLPQ